MSLLTVNNLQLEFTLTDGIVMPVRDLSFTVESGEILGIVGESGSGKTQSMLAIMGLLSGNYKLSGQVTFMEHELLNLKPVALNKIRGNQLAMIFQDALNSLNPYLTIATQMSEVLILHQGVSKADAIKKSIEMLEIVKIADAKERIKHYPHEFSGGMRQRIMLAQALLCKPRLLIADEPTTSLDVTVQAQILELIRELNREFNMSVILVTHDMGVVANICDRVNVMYAGCLMESGSVDEVFRAPLNPYTKALLAAMPEVVHNDNVLKPIPGEPPNLMQMPRGCAFAPRCNMVEELCKSDNNIAIKYLGDNKKRLTRCIKVTHESWY